MRRENLRLSDTSLQVKLARYVSKGFLSKNGRDAFKVSERGDIFFKVPILYQGEEEDYYG